MKVIQGIVLFIVLSGFAGAVRAGPYGDDLSKCLVAGGSYTAQNDVWV